MWEIDDQERCELSTRKLELIWNPLANELVHIANLHLLNRSFCLTSILQRYIAKVREIEDGRSLLTANTSAAFHVNNTDENIKLNVCQFFIAKVI